MVELMQGFPPYSGVFISRSVGSDVFYFNKYEQGVGWLNGHGGCSIATLLRGDDIQFQRAERDTTAACSQNRFNKYEQGVGWLNGHGGCSIATLLRGDDIQFQRAERDTTAACSQNREWVLAREPDLFDL